MVVDLCCRESINNRKVITYTCGLTRKNYAMTEARVDKNGSKTLFFVLTPVDLIGQAEAKTMQIRRKTTLKAQIMYSRCRQVPAFEAPFFLIVHVPSLAEEQDFALDSLVTITRRPRC